MNRQDVLGELAQNAPNIAPSMLKCDYGALREEISLLASAGTKLIHWDVMDGHFVPNLSYGAPVIASLRKQTPLIFDAHLMIQDPGKYLDDYLKAGCDCITFHHEADGDSGELLKAIRDANRVSGLAINPGTPADAIFDVLPLCDLVLVMSVEPGFGGQSFMPSALGKLEQIRGHESAPPLLSVDGGIGPKTITQTAAAGANVFVVGSAIFDQEDYKAAVESLQDQANVTA